MSGTVTNKIQSFTSRDECHIREEKDFSFNYLQLQGNFLVLSEDIAGN